MTAREERTARAAAAHPLGSMITTTIHSIGGRSELVSGEVVDHKRGQVVAATNCHGRIVVALDGIEATS